MALTSCYSPNSSYTFKQQGIVDVNASLNETKVKLDSSIRVIYQDKENNYWFAGGKSGVFKYSTTSDFDKTNQPIVYTRDDGLCSHDITGIQEDKHGNIYFETPCGIHKFDGEDIVLLKTASGDVSGEWRLHPDDLWFRMGWNGNGPYRYDSQLEVLYQLEFPPLKRADEFYSSFPNANWSPYGIYDMFRDRRGHMWFGTASLGLCRYDGRSISWLYEDDLTTIPGGGDFGIRSMIEDRTGYFWFCNARHKYAVSSEITIDDGTNLLKYERLNGLGYFRVGGQEKIPYFMSMAVDDEGHLWMASYDEGVWRHDGKNLSHYSVRKDNQNALLFSIYNDRAGDLWLGSHNAGVFKFNGTDFEKFVL